jgi:multidrug efflux pump subunit AcrB
MVIDRNKNGILLLDSDQKFRAEGVPAEEAMIKVGERLRPIMMTALATVAGMVWLGLALAPASDAATPGHRGRGGIPAPMVLSLR